MIEIPKEIDDMMRKMSDDMWEYISTEDKKFKRLMKVIEEPSEEEKK